MSLNSYILKIFNIKLPSMLFKYWVTCSLPSYTFKVTFQHVSFQSLLFTHSGPWLHASSQCLLNPVQRAVSLKQHVWSVILSFILTSVKNGLALHWVSECFGDKHSTIEGHWYISCCGWHSYLLYDALCFLCFRPKN